MAEVAGFAAMSACLIAAAVWDVREQRVPNALTYGMIAGGLVYWTAAAWLLPELGLASGTGASLAAAICGFVPAAALFGAGGFGGGDVKLLAGVGAVSADWRVVVGTVFLGLVVSAVWAVWIMVRRGLVRRTASRIVTAAMMVGSRVKPDLSESPESPRVPLAVGFAAGGAASGLVHMIGWDWPWAIRQLVTG